MTNEDVIKVIEEYLEDYDNGELDSSAFLKTVKSLINVYRKINEMEGYYE